MNNYTPVELMGLARELQYLERQPTDIEVANRIAILKNILIDRSIKPFAPFKDKYGRYMRVVWYGITRLRLSDNRGRKYLMSYEQLINIM